MMKVATVVGIIVAGLAYVPARCRSADSFENAPPAVTVELTYDGGARAEVVADIIAAPIERQLEGMEKMSGMTSKCGPDGSYSLTVTFERGTNLDNALESVRQRVKAAAPALPEPALKHGITFRKKSAGLLTFVRLYSPEGRYDRLYLSNYFAIHVQDVLTRTAGVDRIVVLGRSQAAIRMVFDPDRLKALDLTAIDVKWAIQEQREKLGLDQITWLPEGKGVRIAFSTAAGELNTAKTALADLIVKTNDKGVVVRVSDVAALEKAVQEPDTQAQLDGKPTVLAAVYLAPKARPRDVSAALQDRLAELRKSLPQGVEMDVPFDFARNPEQPKTAQAPEYLRLELNAPVGASQARTVKAMERCAAQVRKIEGVRDVLALHGRPLVPASNQALLLVRLMPTGESKPGRDHIEEHIRKRVELKDGEELRLCDLVEPGRFLDRCYPVDLTVEGPKLERVQKFAEKLFQRLRQTGKLTDLALSPGATPAPQLDVNLDRDKARTLGIGLEYIEEAVQAYADRNDTEPSQWAKALESVKVRGSSRKMIPLSTIATVSVVHKPLVLERHNGQPSAGITAKPAPGVSLSEARSLCDKIAAEVRADLQLSNDYRLARPAPAPSAK